MHQIHNKEAPQTLLYPVALDARAELLESRALTSMMQYSKDDGCKAYWMLHSPTMPRCRTTLMAVSLSMWYSSLDKVWLGATTMESPNKEQKEGKNYNYIIECMTVFFLHHRILFTSPEINLL